MNSAERDRVIVIGGGLGGLAAACVLAARGRRVVLLERNSAVGGKAVVWSQDGYRFDMGPTILTVPSVLRRIFAEAGRRLEDYLQLERLDPQWRCFFADGQTLDLVEDVESMARDLTAFTNDSNSGEGYRKFIQLSADLDRISDTHFFWKSIGSVFDMFDPRAAFKPGMLGDVLKMRLGSSVAATVRAHARDPRVAQMLDHFTQYVGSAPDASPAVLCGIAHMQTNEGIWYPRGGTRAIPEALSRLADELGVRVRTDTHVERILIERGRVTGVLIKGGERLDCAGVVSNCDSVRTHCELLPVEIERRFARRRRYEPACSGVVLYLGLRKRYEHLLHHNFVFSRDAHEEFDAIYKQGEPAPDPTAYVCAPSASDPSVAPVGGEALYVLVHTPYLRPHHDWSALAPHYRAVILNKLAETAGLDDLSNRIVTESILTPDDIQRRYHVLKGAIYGLASHGRLWGAFKPANRSPDVRGLYLAGGSAHPGPGMPMVLMSGWIAADTLDRDDPLSPRETETMSDQLSAAN